MADGETIFQGTEAQREAADRSLLGKHPPTRVPGYRLERSLGSGAYGQVWLATDENTGRKVAIKFYTHRGGLDWSLLSREVEKLAFLFADRRVVQLLGVGWDADPPYYIMEYLAQGSLEDYLRTGPLPVNQAVDIFREVAVALVHSHAKGVLHCDLKPANVLLDQDLNPRLADFGQSRLSNEQSPALGTLFYMAPEQADLEAIPNASWDVYALGALLYRMLTGEPPHYDKDVAQSIDRAAPLEGRLRAYRERIQKSPCPSAHRKAPGVDKALTEIIDRCLEPMPQRRFPNVQLVLNALEARRVQRARRPLLILGALGPALFLIVMSLFAWSAWRTALNQSTSAVLNRAAQSNNFAAMAAARAVAQKIGNRWHLLELTAKDPEFKKLVKDAIGHSGIEDPMRKPLQDHLDKAHLVEAQGEGNAWLVIGPDGTMLARSPQDPKTIGQNFMYRDYFHGGGKDAPRGTTGLAPITTPYKSIVFEGRSAQRPIVAFSVCVWSGPPGDPDRSVMAVLAMTVELGKFTELKTEDEGGRQQAAVLVDRRPDEAGKRGTILEHPQLTNLQRRLGSAKLPMVYLPPDEVARLDKLSEDTMQLLAMEERAKTSESVFASESGARAKLEARIKQESVDNDYRDPFGGEYGGQWLAAASPVLVGLRDESLKDTGWAILVQERQESITAPIQVLERNLLYRVLAAFGFVILVITGLWGAVILVLSDTSSFPFLSRLKRKAGLATATGSLGSSLSKDGKSTETGRSQ